MNGSRIRNWRSVCLTSEPISSAWLHMAKLTPILDFISKDASPLYFMRKEGQFQVTSAATLLPCQPDSPLSPLSSLSRWSFCCASSPFLPSSLKFPVLPLIPSIQYFIFVYHSQLPFLKQGLPLNAFFQKDQGIMFLAFIVTSVKVAIIWGCNAYPKCCL